MPRAALLALLALMLDASLLAPARAAQVCAWIVESLEDDGGHKFEVNLSADAPTSVSARVQGATFTSAALGGEMIELVPGEPKNIDGEGFDVSEGDDLRFDVQLFDRPIASLEEMDHPIGKQLAAFVFQRKVGADERAVPADLAAKQCKVLG